MTGGGPSYLEGEPPIELSETPPLQLVRCPATKGNCSRRPTGVRKPL